MYLPPLFEVTQSEVLLDLIRQFPLATVVSQWSGGMVADHIPLHFQADESHRMGRFIGHVAKNNPLWQGEGQPHLLIFQGLAAYISPNWYPTKKESGKVVPTYNYAVVHVKARLQVVRDPALLLATLNKQTGIQESAQQHPWKVSDAPADYTDALMKSIVGIEFAILDMVGKFKLSQNQPAQNKAGVIEGLNKHDSEAMSADALMAHWVEKASR